MTSRDAKVAVIAILIAVAAFIVITALRSDSTGDPGSRPDSPSYGENSRQETGFSSDSTVQCPSEDSCTVDYRDGQWFIEETTP